MSKFFGFSSFYSGNFGFLFVCLCFWVIGFGVELVVLTESEVFFFHWLVEGETKGIWNFGFLFFCVGVLVLVTNFYEFLVYLCWGWISWIWGWGRNVKFGVFLYFFYWVWIGYFFKKVIFLGGLIGFGLFLFIFIWLMRKWRRAERVWNLVFCSWKGCECLISWPIGFEGFLNFGIIWVWLNCIDSVRECDFWLVLIGMSVPFLPEEELKRKENC